MAMFKKMAAQLPPLFSLFQPPLMLLRHFESAVSPFMRRSNM